jgi:hypothetical protein
MRNHRIQRWRRLAVTLLLSALTALTVAGVAAAHFVYTSGDLVKGPICVLNGSGIAEGPATGGGQVIAEIWTQAYGKGFCLTAKAMPAGYQYLRRQVFHWNGSEWRLCADSGDTFNSSPSSYRAISRDWTRMPCGGGWYGTIALGYAWHNGQWLGGDRWSGYHYF